MTIAPSGSPAWTRTAAHTDYGGHTQKRNYLSRGMIDALTDVGAEELTRIAADMEALARVSPFATLTYLCSDAAPAAPTVETVYMMTGVRVVSYLASAAPTGFPSAARTGTGEVLFTFATSYTDAYGVVGAFAPAHAMASAHGAGEAACTVEISGATVRVRTYANGVAVGNRRVTLQVW